jgi:hypothetical protein
LSARLILAYRRLRCRWASGTDSWADAGWTAGWTRNLLRSIGVVCVWLRILIKRKEIVPAEQNRDGDYQEEKETLLLHRDYTKTIKMPVRSRRSTHLTGS